MIKSKKDALASITPFVKKVGESRYNGFFAYIGTEKLTHRKISFWKARREDLEAEIDTFYATMEAGASPSTAQRFSARDMADYTLARDILAKAGHSNVTLVEIARDWTRVHGALNASATIGDAYEEYLAHYSEFQKEQRRTVKMTVGRLVRESGPSRRVSSFDTAELSAYMSRLFGAAAPKTFNNHRNYLKAFFNWCAEKPRQFIAGNPMDDIRNRAEAYEEPKFIEAGTLRRIFDNVLQVEDVEQRNKWIWQMALTYFNGIRAAELERLRLCDVLLDVGEVRVAFPKGFQHGVAPRMVELTDAAKAWMRAYPLVRAKDGGAPSPDAPFLSPSEAKRGLRGFILSLSRKGLLEQIPDNAARHSFITMHVALNRDPRWTEALVGTSSSMRVKHYMGLATKAQAEEYFSVLPDAFLSPGATATA